MTYMFKVAEAEDSGIVKDLINKMYGVPYEMRGNEEISKAINEKKVKFMCWLLMEINV